MNSQSASPAARVALHPENIPSSLTALNQWCVWKYGPKRRNGKRSKIPFQPNGKPAKSNDCMTWYSFAWCLETYQSGGYDGIGVFLARNLAGVDLDNCRDTDGATPDAAEILGKFAGTYAEVSPSGAGYRCFCYGKPAHSGKRGFVEVYAEPSSRFLTVTGNVLTPGAEVTEQQAALDWLHARYFAGATPEAEPDAASQPEADATSEPDATPPPVFTSLSDAELVEKACASSAKFATLWRGDTSLYLKETGEPDTSQSDMALCGLLSWWTNSDAAQMDRLFRQSGLYDREWDSKRGDATYGAKTIAKAIANCSGGYSGQRPDGGGHAEAGSGKHGCGGSGGAGSVPGGAGGGKKTWVSGTELLRMEFPEPVWLLPDVLPESGLFLLSGKPKAGKSWLVLALAMAVTTGGQCIGRKVPNGYVLVMSLEDNLRRLKNRMVTLEPDAVRCAEAFRNLAFRTLAPTVAAGLDTELADFLKRLAARGVRVRLVVLDTLQKVRGATATNGNQYALDYDVLSRLKRVADDAGVCLVVVHHLRKQEGGDDVHDAISGTLGLAGAADGSLVLVRQRGGDAAVLHITGRDMPESELGLKFDGHSWTYAGNAAEVRASAEQNELIALLKEYGTDGATAATLARDADKKPPAVKFLLRKLVDAGRVRVRNTKPAPHYALVDGEGPRSQTDTTHPFNKEGVGDDEPTNTTYTTYTANTTYTTYTTYTSPEGNEAEGVSGVSLGTRGYLHPEQPDGKRVNAEGVSGVSGSSSTTTDTDTWFEV